MVSISAKLAVLSLLLRVSLGHVALTFPAPRQINYDFLDNIRTESPCGGQPKGEPLTELKAGTNVTITWHLGYPHRGGFRVELLPANDNISAATQLYPTDPNVKWGGADDTTRTSVQVKIPSDKACENCTIRFLREALEWGATYTFWTCADVKIVTTQTEPCSGKGVIENAECKCNPKYYGDRCQYWNECDADSDCLNGGKCVDTYAVSNPRKQCFCAAGFFGLECKKVSAVKSLNGLQLDTYRMNTLSDDYTLYHKLVGNEIEMVVKVKTNTWIGLGWKPTDATACRSLDHGSAEPESEGTSEPESEPSPESTAEGTAEPASEGAPETTAEAESEVTSSGGGSGTGQDVVVITSEADYLRSQGLAASFANYSCEVGRGGKGAADPESTSETVSEEPASEKPASEEPASEEPASEGAPEGETEPEAESEGGALHPMDCTDMVIMAVSEGFSRINDAYSRDRSTPKFDTDFGAMNSLTAAVGEEKDGMTTILFRRPITGEDERDYTIEDAPMSVIWAYGQEHLKYVHNPLTGLEFCTVRDIFFYRKDVLMYHGHSGKRGGTTINFITEPAMAFNSYGIDDDTFVRWSYNDNTKNVEFELNAAVDTGSWVALGITSNRQMAQTDVIHVGIDDGGMAVASDRYATGYSLPQVDATETSINTDYQNGKLVATFARSASEPTDDTDVSVSACQHLLIARGSGFTGTGFNQHGSSPSISEKKFCFLPSTPPSSSTSATTISSNVLLATIIAAIFTLLK